MLIGAVYPTITAGTYFANALIGHSAGLLIGILLLVLTLRAAKGPAWPLANIAFAVCALLWSAGGLAHAVLRASGLGRGDPWALFAEAVQYSGAAAFPIPILAVWRRSAASGWQRGVGRILQWVGSVAAAIVTVFLVRAALVRVSPGSMPPLKLHVLLNATLLLIFGAALMLRARTVAPAIYRPSLAMVLTVCGAALSVAFALHGNLGRGVEAMLAFISGHLILLLIVCAFLLFARFRYADVFIRYSTRILIAAIWASGLTTVAQRSWPVNGVWMAVWANLLLLSFAFAGDQVSDAVNRWLFHPPDYRAAAREFAAQLRGLESGAEILAALEERARVTLTLGVARAQAIGGVDVSGSREAVVRGEMVELDSGTGELLVPVTSGGAVSHVLLVAPGPARPGLVTNDLNFLRGLAGQTGNRLDALRMERETIERRSREAVLQQQVAEAELRALRAQIHPHFLFNSLNTIADLTVRNPAGAETMTLRLASVFRHVLAHTSRPLTSVRDEIDFVRTYLYIEEARFGERLQVAIDTSPEVAGEQIPSLILQPLVENALKHGLGPKPGQGHLWIGAHPAGEHIRLTIEDDGMGFQAGPSGLGLENVRERLKTLYQDRASLSIEAREGGGTRVTVLTPRGRL